MRQYAIIGLTEYAPWLLSPRFRSPLLAEDFSRNPDDGQNYQLDHMGEVDEPEIQPPGSKCGWKSMSTLREMEYDQEAGT